jgi:integrase
MTDLERRFLEHARRPDRAQPAPNVPASNAGARKRRRPRRGKGALYVRGGGLWWYDFTDNAGRRHRGTTGTTDREEARDELERQKERREQEVTGGGLAGPDPAKLVFEDLAAMLLRDYRVNGRKSVERAEASIKRLAEFFGGQKVRAITRPRLDAYVCERLEARPKKPAAKPATIQKELAALRRMFSLAVDGGLVTPSRVPKFPTLEVRNARAGFFEPGELRAVLAHLPEHLRPPVLFAYVTGWRKSEVLGLTWDRVDLAASVVRLEPGTTKNDEGRSFPFDEGDELSELLKAQRERRWALERETGRDVPWVFFQPTGRAVHYFRRAWIAACKDAGVEGRLFHDLRRTAVRDLERGGVSRSVAMKLTGHKTEEVYRRYAIVSEADLREGVRKSATARLRHKQRHSGAPEPRKVGWMTGIEPATPGATVQCSTD